MNPESSTPGAVPGLSRLCRALLPVWERHMAVAQQQSDDGVQQLLQQFAALRELVHRMPAGDDADRAHQLTDQILTGFLFHDRVSQMLGILSDDMEKLLAQIEAGPQADLEPERWLQALESRYVMEEQRASHAGRATEFGADDGDGLTCF